MEDFKKYCYNSNEFNFVIDEMEFTCEEMTVGEEALFFNYYIDPNGTENLAKLGLSRATKLKDTPFTKDWIKHLIDIEKDWKDLNSIQRLKFLELLKSNFISKILKIVNNHYKEIDTITKN